MRRWLVLGGLVAALAVAWFFLGRQLGSPEEVAGLIRQHVQTPLGLGLAPLGFAVALLLFVPITVLIIGCALVLPPLQAFAVVMVGAVLGALGTWGLGRVTAGPVLQRFQGERWQRLMRQLRTHPFRATLMMRFLPIGGFSPLNLFAGAVGVPLGGYVLGNVVGVLPAAVLFTLLGGHLPGLLEKPQPLHFALLGGAVLLVVGASFFIKRWASKEAHGELRPEERGL